MSYRIGLDIGITSVGWAVIEIDSNDEPKRIINLGTRIFNAAENPKDGSSLAKPRREARSVRRRLRRHSHRLERIKNLIIENKLLTKESLEKLFTGKLSDIYSIRVESLDRKIDNNEFARLLIHLAQRRGFISNRKSDAADKEAGLLLNAVKQNKELLISKGYLTVGEMLFCDDKFKYAKRNKLGDYSHTIDRSMILEEIKLIFEAQRKFGQKYASEDFEQKFIDIFTSQRSFDKGPGGNSPYGGNQIEKMIGYCTFEEGKKRAVKSSYSFEYFNLLQNINNIRITSPEGIRALTDSERYKIIQLAHSTADLKYSKIRKELLLGDNEYFVGLSYGKKSIDEIEEKSKFNYLNSYHQIRKCLDRVSKGSIKQFSREQLNEIGYALTVFKNDKQIEEHLVKINIPKEFINELLTLSGFSKVGHLSIEACEKLIPFLEQGKKYNEACEAVGYNFIGHNGKIKSKYLPSDTKEFDNITNPVVRRAVSQTIKVINAIIREQGESPSFINIELAREMSKNFEERNKIKKIMEENRDNNERIMERIRNEYGKLNPTGMDLIKLKLWEEQSGICPYSISAIDISRLFEPGYVDIDHIVPYSISFDDSYKNKVLVKSKENRQKGNQLPLQYLKGKQRDDFIVWVNNTIRDNRKKQLLLKENITKEDEEAFTERNLQDTRYISKLLYNFINDYLEFAPSQTKRKKRVTAVNGFVTSYLRKRWGITKIRECGDLHHAVDAVVVACTTEGMIQKVSRYNKYNEIKYTYKNDENFHIDISTGELTDEFPLPWPLFRKELDIRLSNNPSELLSQIKLPNYSDINTELIKPIFVSRMPNRKVSGPAHEDTVKSLKALNEGVLIVRKPLTELKLTKDNEIENYYKPESDRRLYTAIKNRLQQYGGDAKIAFKDKFYKPTKSGLQGPEVKKVKLVEKSTLFVSVHGGKGAAKNEKMIRIDVFYVPNDGYYFVPIYVADTLKETLPNKAVVAYKRYEEWKEMKDEDFIFSLYPNDLIKVTSRRNIKLGLVNKENSLPKEILRKSEFLYYISADISVGTIHAVNHDNAYFTRLGVKTLESLEKYQVDVLGNYNKVHNEKRQYFK